MSSLNIAVIGTGYLGKFHVQKYAQMPHVNLVGVVDTDRERAEQIAQEYQTKAFTQYEDLFGQVDAVSIVVPTQLHHKVAKDCLLNNLDVLIEKPITRSIEQADELIDLAKEKKRLIQVGHLERFNPVVEALRDKVNNPLFIESHRIAIYKGRGIDVSVVLDLMIHDIDLIKNFARSEVVSIHAAGVPVICSDVDIANARIAFEKGCIANVTASRISMKEERKIRIFQKDAYFSVDFAKKNITYIHQNPDKKSEANEIIPGMEIQKLHFSEGDALHSELQAFVSCVQSRKIPEVPGKAGRDALKIALDIMAQISSKIS
jgi:predicted dehydrogenase